MRETRKAKVGANGKVSTTFSFDPEAYEKLRALARASGLPMARVVEYLVNKTDVESFPRFKMVRVMVEEVPE